MSDIPLQRSVFEAPVGFEGKCSTCIWQSGCKGYSAGVAVRGLATRMDSALTLAEDENDNEALARAVSLKEAASNLGMLESDFQERVFRLWGNLVFCSGRSGGAFSDTSSLGSRGLNAVAVLMQVDTLKASLVPAPVQLRTSLSQYQPPSHSGSDSSPNDLVPKRV